MFDWARKQLGVVELEDRMSEMEDRIGTIESYIVSILDNFGSYSSRTDEELSMMVKQMTDMEETLESLIKNQENMRDIQRAKKAQKRVRQNKTRAMNALGG